MEPDNINAISAGLSAFAAIFAVVIGAISIVQLRKSEERANHRDANQRDESLQIRLEALYPSLYRVFGAPSDGIPLEIRPAVISFFGLYADAFSALQDDLLPEGAATSLLEEFDWWLGSRNGQGAWNRLRTQSWPRGFADHVDAVARRERGYSSLDNGLPHYMLHTGAPGTLEVRRNPSDDLLRSADWTLVSLRRSSNPEFPPSSLDLSFQDVQDPNDQLDAQLSSYATWLVKSDTPVWCRWIAVLDGRAVGHVAVCEPHSYLNPLGGDTGPSTGMLEVSRLFIDPRLQRMGIASVLLKCAVELIQDFGCTPALAVLAESRSALAMYRKLGWAERGRFNGTQGVNILMTLPDEPV